jgi:hypothetical protein
MEWVESTISTSRQSSKWTIKEATSLDKILSIKFAKVIYVKVLRYYGLVGIIVEFARLRWSWSSKLINIYKIKGFN